MVIAGPTATGKTNLAIGLANKFDGEIVSADSRQVYKDMNIGTGKDVGNEKLKIKNEKLQSKVGKEINKKFTLGVYELKGIPVWLYDVTEPDFQFSAADYVRCAKLVINDIWQRGKLPILVGGTGFYIKALVDGVETLGMEPDWELRKRLGNLGIDQLRKILEKTCPERIRKMNESDRSNPRRLIRAIEIATQPQSAKCKAKSSKLRIGNLLTIGLKAPYKILYQRIDKRVEERVAQGIEKEIGGLIKKGYSFENSVLGTTIGYKEWQALISNIKHPISDIIVRWQLNEHQYAKRQMTWFKADLRIRWFDVTKANFGSEVETLVKEWYDKEDEASED